MAKRNRPSPAPAPSSQRRGFVFGLIAGVAVVAAVLFFVLDREDASVPPQAAAPPPSAAPQPQQPPPPPAFSEADVASAARIEAAEARRLLDAGAAVAIDVRDVQSFTAGHIPGALQIPYSYVQGEVPYFPRDKKLITYCT